MATVTVAEVGVSAATTVARVDGPGVAVDVFPAYFAVSFGVLVGSVSTMVGVG